MKIHTNYIVYSQGRYINTCDTYREACEMQERLERLWGREYARITIEIFDWYE